MQGVPGTARRQRRLHLLRGASFGGGGAHEPGQPDEDAVRGVEEHLGAHLNRGVVVTEAGSYLRLINVCITQLKDQGPSRTCNESNKQQEAPGMQSARPVN